MDNLNSEETEIVLFDITLGDFLVFINWMNRSERALNQAESLPPPPRVTSSKILEWIHLIHTTLVSIIENPHPLQLPVNKRENVVASFTTFIF